MSMRLRCSVNPIHQLLLSNFLGRIYPPADSPNKPEPAEKMLEAICQGIDGKPSTYKRELFNMSGAINVGVLYNDSIDETLEDMDPQTIAFGVVRIPLVLTPGIIYCGVASNDGGFSAGLTSGGMPFLAVTAKGRGDMIGAVTYVGGSPRLPVPGGGWCMFSLAPGVTAPQAGYYDLM